MNSLSHTHALAPSPTHIYRLSSGSFLDSVLTVDAQPAYAIDTRETLTTLSRCDSHGLHKVATVHWPFQGLSSSKGKKKASTHDVIVNVNGRSYTEDDFLKRSVMSSSRKFRVPGYPEPFKWRHIPTRDTFECTIASSTIPLAVYEPAVLTARSRVKIFAGALGLDRVSQTLLDHIILTALLVTTNMDEWRGIAVPFPSSTLPAYAILDSELEPRRPTKAATTVSRSSTMYTRRRSISLHPSPAFLSGSMSSSSATSSPTSCTSPLPFDTFYPSPPVSPSSPDSEFFAWPSKEYMDEPPPPYEQIQWTVRVPTRQLLDNRYPMSK